MPAFWMVHQFMYVERIDYGMVPLHNVVANCNPVSVFYRDKHCRQWTTVTISTLCNILCMGRKLLQRFQFPSKFVPIYPLLYPTTWRQLSLLRIMTAIIVTTLSFPLTGINSTMYTAISTGPIIKLLLLWLFVTVLLMLVIRSKSRMKKTMAESQVYKELWTLMPRRLLLTWSMHHRE